MPRRALVSFSGSNHPTLTSGRRPAAPVSMQGPNVARMWRPRRRARLGAMGDDGAGRQRATAAGWLRGGASTRVLAAGDAARRLLAGDGVLPEHTAVIARPAPSAPVERWLDTLRGEQRFDAAVLSGAVESPDEGDVAVVLARLRDLHAARVLLLAPETGALRTDLIALGMERLQPGDEGASPALYVFDIGRYKRTPDWLNARHWANPELWDKHRW